LLTAFCESRCRKDRKLNQGRLQFEAAAPPSRSSRTNPRPIDTSQLLPRARRAAITVCHLVIALLPTPREQSRSLGVGENLYCMTGNYLFRRVGIQTASNAAVARHAVRCRKGTSWFDPAGSPVTGGLAAAGSTCPRNNV
jgi:hypothetical protein